MCRVLHICVSLKSSHFAKIWMKSLEAIFRVFSKIVCIALHKQQTPFYKPRFFILNLKQMLQRKNSTPHNFPYTMKKSEKLKVSIPNLVTIVVYLNELWNIWLKLFRMRYYRADKWSKDVVEARRGRGIGCPTLTEVPKAYKV